MDEGPSSSSVDSLPVVFLKHLANSRRGPKPVPLLRPNSPLLQPHRQQHNSRGNLGRGGLGGVSRAGGHSATTTTTTATHRHRLGFSNSTGGDDEDGGGVNSKRGRERLATKLLIREGYPSEPVTAVTHGGYRQLPFAHAAPLQPKAAAGLPGRVGGRTNPKDGKVGRDASYASTRRGVVDAPTNQSWITGGGGGAVERLHPRRRADVVRSLISESHEMSREVMQSTVRTIEYFSTVEAPPLTAAELAWRLRTPPEERMMLDRRASSADADADADAAAASESVEISETFSEPEPFAQRADEADDGGEGGAPVVAGAEVGIAAEGAFASEGRGAAAAATATAAAAAAAEIEGNDGETDRARITGGEARAPSETEANSGRREPQSGALLLKQVSFPESIAVGGPANDRAAAPQRHRSSMQQRCVPRPWQSHGAGYRKPAKLDKFNRRYFDGDAEDAEDAEDGDTGGAAGAASSAAAVEEGRRRRLVPRVVDAAGEARRQMSAAALEALEAAAAAEEAAREAEDQELADRIAKVMGRERTDLAADDAYFS